MTTASLVTCIIPAYNEEATIGDVVGVIKQVKEIGEILVIDDGSSDGTGRVAKEHGARVVRHVLNLGKGAAMKRGAQKAKYDLIVYVDADLQNLEAASVRKLVRPLVRGEADFVKAGYQYAQGRVTKLVVQPLLNIVYPFFKLEHPLSGEIALNRKKFDFEKIEDGWGVDIQLVLQAAKHELQIKEVSLGNKEHKHQSLDELSNMSEQILRTILSDLQLIAHNYKLLFFDLDKTLITCSSIEVLSDAWGFERELEDLRKRVASGDIPDKEITKTLVRHFAGRTQGEVSEVCRSMKINKYAAELIAQLRAQRYRVRIISAAYSPVVQHFCSQLNVYEYVCPRLQRDAHKRFNGKLRPSRFEDKQCRCCGMYVCKKKGVDAVRKRFGIEREQCVAIGDGKSDACMFDVCGLSLGYKTSMADHRIGNLSEVMMYLD